MLRPLLVALALPLAACVDNTQFFAPPALVSDLKVNAQAQTVMVNEISIPEYAVNQEIPIQSPDGSLTTDTERLWADLPDRAMQVALTRHLNQITDAAVAIEPWPLSGFPEKEVTVTVEDMIVRSDGTLGLTGFFAIRDDTEGRGRIETFDLSVPVADLSYTSIISSHETAWLLLAEAIARQL